jgi:hypothetical protein
LREKEFDKKFRNEKEQMVGNKPITKWLINSCFLLF